jgi:hypothetical protein
VVHFGTIPAVLGDRILPYYDIVALMVSKELALMMCLQHLLLSYTSVSIFNAFPHSKHARGYNEPHKLSSTPCVLSVTKKKQRKHQPQVFVWCTEADDAVPLC